MNHLDRINAIINGIPEPTVFRTIDADGTEFWKNKEGQLHRDGDLPAVIYANGAKYWWKNGQLHRDGDKPAIIFANGEEEYYNNGVQYEPHR